MNPASENTIEVSSTAATTSAGVLDLQVREEQRDQCDHGPTSRPAPCRPDVAEHDQPVRQRRDQQLLDVRPNLAPKNELTTLP